MMFFDVMKVGVSYLVMGRFIIKVEDFIVVLKVVNVLING